VNAVIAFIKLGRLKFLGGGFILYALGAAVAAAAGHAIDLSRYLLGQGAVTAFQLMTHYANDYFDYDADIANATPTAWSGGSRVLPDGGLPRSAALGGAVVFAAIGSALTLVLALRGAGALAAPSLALILVLAWGYSAPPQRLCARGLGELDTAIVVTVLVPWLGFYLQAPDLRGGAQLALTLVPLVALQFAMLLAIEFPDAAGDAAAGKHTLVVRLGARTAAQLYAAVTAAAFVWPLDATAGFALPARVALGLEVPAPIAIWRIARLAEHADPAAYERLTFFAVLLVGATSAGALAGWLI
jgi:1,4-dihydroxy-2-naphthoate octaprenyltransferase